MKNLANNIWDEEAVKQYTICKKECTNFLNQVLDKIIDVKGKRVLDFGCGTGELLNFWSEKIAFGLGIDNSFDMIQSAKKIQKNNLRFTHELHNAIPKLQFDVVGTCLVLCMLCKEEIIQICKNMERALEPNGIAYHLIPHPCFVDKAFGHYRTCLTEFNYRDEGINFRFSLRNFSGVELANEKFIDTHHSLSTYINCICSSSFKITKVEEIYSPKNPILGGTEHFPAYLLIVGEKVM